MIKVDFTKVTMKSFKRHLRRWSLIIFRPYYVMEKLSQRRGGCNNCGCCGDYCKDYCHPNCLRWNNLPFLCKLYPIDEKERIDKCGFYWEKKVTPACLNSNNNLLNKNEKVTPNSK